MNNHQGLASPRVGALSRVGSRTQDLLTETRKASRHFRYMNDQKSPETIEFKDRSNHNNQSLHEILRMTQSCRICIENSTKLLDEVARTSLTSKQAPPPGRVVDKTASQDQESA